MCTVGIHLPHGVMILPPCGRGGSDPISLELLSGAVFLDPNGGDRSGQT